MTSKRHAEWDFNPAEPQVQDKYKTSIGQLQDAYRTHTVTGEVPANMQHN